MDKLSADRLSTLKQSFSRLERHVSQMQQRRRQQKHETPDDTQRSNSKRAKPRTKDSKIPVPTPLSTSVEGMPFDPGTHPTSSNGPTVDNSHHDKTQDYRTNQEREPRSESERTGKGAISQNGGPSRKVSQTVYHYEGLSHSSSQNLPHKPNPDSNAPNRRKLARETSSTFRKLTADVNGDGHGQGQGQSHRIWFRSNHPVKARRPLSVDYNEVNVTVRQMQQRPRTVHDDRPIFVKGIDDNSDGEKDRDRDGDVLVSDQHHHPKVLDTAIASGNAVVYSVASPASGITVRGVYTNGTLDTESHINGSSQQGPSEYCSSCNSKIDSASNGNSNSHVCPNCNSKIDGASNCKTDGSSKSDGCSNCNSDNSSNCKTDGCTNCTPKAESASRSTPRGDLPARPRSRRSLPNVPDWGDVEGRKRRLSLQALQKIQTDSEYEVTVHRSLDIDDNCAGFGGGIGSFSVWKSLEQTYSNSNVDAYAHVDGDDVQIGAGTHNGADCGSELNNHTKAMSQALNATVPEAIPQPLLTAVPKAVSLSTTALPTTLPKAVPLPTSALSSTLPKSIPLPTTLLKTSPQAPKPAPLPMSLPDDTPQAFHTTLPPSPMRNTDVQWDRDLNLSTESAPDIDLDEHSAEMESILALKSAESSHDTGFTSPSKDLSTWSVQTQLLISQTKNEGSKEEETKDYGLDEHKHMNDPESGGHKNSKDYEQGGHKKIKDVKLGPNKNTKDQDFAVEMKDKHDSKTVQSSKDAPKGVPKFSDTLQRIIDELKKEPGQKEDHSKVKQWRKKFANKTSIESNKPKTYSQDRNHPSLQQLLQCCDLMTIRFYKEKEDSLNFKLVDCEFTESAILDSTVPGCCRPPNGAKTIRLGSGGGAFVPIAPAKPSSPPQYVIAVEQARACRGGGSELKDGDCLLEVNRVSVVEESAEDVMTSLEPLTGWVYLVVARRRCRMVGNPYELSKEVEKLRVKYETLKSDAEKSHDVIADLRLDLQDREEHLEALQKNAMFAQSRFAVAEELREKQERLATHWRQQWQQKVVEMEDLKEQLHRARQHQHNPHDSFQNGRVVSPENVMDTDHVVNGRRNSGDKIYMNTSLKMNDNATTSALKRTLAQTRLNHTEQTYGQKDNLGKATVSKTRHIMTNGKTDTALNSPRRAYHRLSYDSTTDNKLRNRSRKSSDDSLRYSLDSESLTHSKDGNLVNRRDYVEDTIKLKCAKPSGGNVMARDTSNGELQKCHDSDRSGKYPWSNGKQDIHVDGKQENIT